MVIIEDITTNVVHMKIWRNVEVLLVIHLSILNFTTFAIVLGLFFVLCSRVVWRIIYMVEMPSIEIIAKSERELTKRVVSEVGRKICVEKIPEISFPTLNWIL